jgi:osmotically-inducible protein OsmY
MSDTLLRQNVLEELDFEPSVNDAHIGVVADKGVVTLTGHVSSYAEKLAAEAAVKRVKGVRAIAQEIEVRYPFEKKTADDEIASRALSILRWSAVIPQNAVQLEVEDGWITLTGDVDWQFQRIAAEAQLRRLSGVAGVINRISIKPHVRLSDVKDKVEKALRRSAKVEAENIQISVLDGDKISLRGKVHDWQERAMVENAAWSVPGVVAVEDHLTIS